MTEADWFTATDPRPMLAFLRGRATERKLRLFGVAACRQAADLFPDRRLHDAVRVAEWLADGGVTEAERVAAEMAADAAAQEAIEVDDLNYHLLTPRSVVAARYDADAAASDAASIMYASVWQGEQTFDGIDAEVRTEQADLLRELFGNPFHSVAFDPSHRTEAVFALARGMYESRDFSAAPVLADALEDAGCGDAEVLGHLRGGGVHVRGCWCVDGVLGLE
jgi:hypothetical protein